MMDDRYLLTPFFLDQPLEGLLPLAQDDWRIIRPVLPDGEGEARADMARMAVLYEALAEEVADAVRDGERPVSIAGDCCTTIGVLAGLQRAGLDPTVLWLDAHGDFNTWDTTPSGFLGGMPLAMLVGRGDQRNVERVGLVPLAETRVILSGARDLDPGEQVLLRASAVTQVPDVAALLAQPLGEGPLYVHFDTDVLKPEDAPAMNYATPGGPPAALMAQVFDHLARSGRVVAVSVSSWNPELDGDGRSRQTIMRLLPRLLG